MASNSKEICMADFRFGLAWSRIKTDTIQGKKHVKREKARVKFKNQVKEKVLCDEYKIHSHLHCYHKIPCDILSMK